LPHDPSASAWLANALEPIPGAAMFRHCLAPAVAPGLVCDRATLARRPTGDRAVRMVVAIHSAGPSRGIRID
jgi:hypothetical protein